MNALFAVCVLATIWGALTIKLIEIWNTYD